MTNETAVATAETPETNIIIEQFDQGKEFCNNVSTWFTEQGIEILMDVIGAALILVFGALAIKLIVAAVGKALTRGGKKQTLLINFTRSVVSKICWTVLLVTVLGKLGVNIGPIVAGLGVTGFILGFAFQESLGNLASGLMIAINEPFKIGDYVIVAGHEGSIVKVDMMATVLATADNKKVVIPNKSAWGSPITNFSALNTRRVDLKIGIAYGCDVAKAVEIATATLKSVPKVLADPAPAVSVASLDDSQVTLNIRPWANCADYWNVYDGAYQAVKAAFDREGINIPFPQLNVHVDHAGDRDRA